MAVFIEGIDGVVGEGMGDSVVVLEVCVLSRGSVVNIDTRFCADPEGFVSQGEQCPCEEGVALVVLS